MKEHEHPYWMSVHAEGSPTGKHHKEIKKIATKHGGKPGGGMHLEPENVSEMSYGFKDKKSHGKATNEVRKAGHMVAGEDY